MKSVDGSDNECLQHVPGDYPDWIIAAAEKYPDGGSRQRYGMAFGVYSFLSDKLGTVMKIHTCCVFCALALCYCWFPALVRFSTQRTKAVFLETDIAVALKIGFETGETNDRSIVGYVGEDIRSVEVVLRNAADTTEMHGEYGLPNLLLVRGALRRISHISYRSPAGFSGYMWTVWSSPCIGKRGQYRSNLDIPSQDCRRLGIS